MCGIAGILRVQPSGPWPGAPEDAIPESWLDRLDQAIMHRGPDGAGRFRDRVLRESGEVVDVAMVHRRLSILDHAGGSQPMVLSAPGGGCATRSPAKLCAGARLYAPGEALLAGRTPEAGIEFSGDEIIAVVFNGCIYNHRELREELVAAGHVFSSDHSDTEVLLHGWRQWKEGLSDRLEGMYAYAVWDRAWGFRLRHGADVFLDRDGVGEKPLYYFSNWIRDSRGGMIRAFSSSWGGLFKFSTRLGPYGCTEFQPSKRLLYHWIRFGYGRTLVRNIGQVASPCSRNAVVRQLWHPETTGPLSVDELDGLLNRAVATRLEADVPLGVFLSGGVDSSLVAHYAKLHLGTVRTLNVRMPDDRFDESGYAQRVSTRIGTDHVCLDCSLDPARDLESLIKVIGLPFGDSSLLPAFWVSKAARGTVKVALTGDGADELFAGYDRYRALDRAAEYWTQIARLRPQILPRRHPKSRGDKLARLIAAARVGDIFDLGAVFPTDDINRLLPERRRQQWTGGVGGHYLRRFDLTNYLPDDILRKTDAASMTVALEVRAPYLDRAVVKRAMGTPYESLVLRGQRKGLLRAVARKYLPADIVDRPKMGFAIPIGDWLRSDYGAMRQLLLDHLNSAEPFGPDSLGINSMINMGFVRQMLREHDDAGSKSLWPWKGRDHSQRLYMMLVLSIWAKWLGGLSQSARG